VLGERGKRGGTRTAANGMRAERAPWKNLREKKPEDRRSEQQLAGLESLKKAQKKEGRSLSSDHANWEE